MLDLTTEEEILLAVFDLLEDWDKDVAQEVIDDINDDREDDDQLTLPMLKAFVQEFEIVESDLIYWGGNPTDSMVIQNKKTGVAYRVMRFHDSWSGSEPFRRTDYGSPKRVELKPVTREEWVEIEE
jgi:hypothetical protein